MAPFFLMLGVFVLIHLPGLRRWPGGAEPWEKAAGAMGVVLLLPAWSHFVEPARFVAMIPPLLPWPEELVLASGVVELIVALGLLVPRSRRRAAWAGIALFLAIWPANIYTAISGDYPAAFSQSPLYHGLRVPFQLLYVGWAGWIALGHIPGRGLRQRLMARKYDEVMATYEEWAGPRRKDLLAGVSGTVVELGPGTGATLPYFDPSVHWIGIEPNLHMHGALLRRARTCELASVQVRGLSAEGMELDDETADAVVCSLVLCSVSDPAAVLRDIKRVLKPEGQLLFLEHVAAPRGTFRRFLQRVVRPIWQCFADGCNPDRETGALIQEAGFRTVEMETFEVPREVMPAFVAPHVSGRALK